MGTPKKARFPAPGSGSGEAGNRETGVASRGPPVPGVGLAAPRKRQGQGAREEGVVYLGRRQEVGPEGGSGRLQGEHGAAVFSARPGHNPGPAADPRQRWGLPTPAGLQRPVRPARPRLRPAGPGGPTGGGSAARPPERGGAGAEQGRRERRGPSPEGAARPAPPRPARRRAQGRRPAAPGLRAALAPGPQRERRRERSPGAILRAQPRDRAVWEGPALGKRPRAARGDQHSAPGALHAIRPFEGSAPGENRLPSPRVSAQSLEAGMSSQRTDRRFHWDGCWDVRGQRDYWQMTLAGTPDSLGLVQLLPSL